MLALSIKNTSHNRSEQRNVYSYDFHKSYPTNFEVLALESFQLTQNKICQMCFDEEIEKTISGEYLKIAFVRNNVCTCAETVSKHSELN